MHSGGKAAQAERFSAELQQLFHNVAAGTSSSERYGGTMPKSSRWTEEKRYEIVMEAIKGSCYYEVLACLVCNLVSQLFNPSSHRSTGQRPQGKPCDEKASSGAGADQLLLESDQTKTPNDCSPDGRFLLFRSIDSRTGNDLWVLPISGDKKPFPFLKTPFDEHDGQFSPDGKWIAYQ